MDIDNQRAVRPRFGTDRESRIEDYLNDKLQTKADLASIDVLLEDLQEQHKLLSRQLDDARSTLQANSVELQRHRENLLHRSKAFKAYQADIDRRLQSITQSETSDDAVTKFEGSMAALQRLEVAHGYMELLRKVEDLASEARRNFKNTPKAALQPYTSLKLLAQSLHAAQPAAEDAAPHLVDHVDRTAQLLWEQMKEAFSSEFERILEKLKWPRKDISLQGQMKTEWTDGVRTLLELQSPELKAHDSANMSKSVLTEPVVLLPLEVMIRPLEIRFRYHFEGDRPTNKLDKPEFFLSHFEDTLNTYAQFFSTYLQPILRIHMKKADLIPNSTFIDSTSAFITAMLPMVRHKMLQTMPRIAKHPNLLSHFVHELMLFDDRLRNDWSYDGGNSEYGWKGLTWELLVTKGWFDKWLSVEKSFALARYKDIINAPESHEIDYDSVDQSATKPTYAAIRVNDLLETISDRYKPLASFSQKLQFLIGIQIEIFDLYHSRLFDSLSKYQVSASSIGRTIQGESREAAAEISGLKGIEHLCRIYGSAEYLEKKMLDWSDDVFFIGLYAQLQYRVINRHSERSSSSSGVRNLAGPMTVEVVAERTSSTIIPSSNDTAEQPDTDPTVTGALFDETASSYKRLRIRTESVLTDTLVSSTRESLHVYTRINPWSALPTSSSFFPPSSYLAPSSELNPLLQTLHSNLQFLSRALALAPLRRIGRQMCLTIQNLLWDSVLLRYSFSPSGIAQFARDVDVTSGVLDKYLGPGQAKQGMRKLTEGVILLSLPSTSSTDEEFARAKNADQEDIDDDDDDDDDVAAWNVEADSPGENNGNSDSNSDSDLAWRRQQSEEGKRAAGTASELSLWEVEKRVFRNNESARQVLEELDLETLSESDARRVLERVISSRG